MLQDTLKTPNPVDLYRKILDKAQDDSITIVSIGFFDNLALLLDSGPDAYSNLTGRELITTKVKDIVVMGGDYPGYSHFVSVVMGMVLTTLTVERNTTLPPSPRS